MSGASQTVVPGMRELWIIYAAFYLSIIMYAVVLALLTSMSALPGEILFSGAVRPVFAVLAAIIAGGSVWYRRRFVAIEARQRLASGEAPAGESGGGLSRSARVNCMVVWAFCEAVAVLGVILGFLRWSADDFYPFAAAGTVLLYLHRPSVWKSG